MRTPRHITEAQRAYQRAWRKRNPRSNKQWRLKNPDKVRAQRRRDSQKARASGKRHNDRIKHLYGINVAQKTKLLEQQSHNCAICKTNTATDIDHCHNTGKIRGILCHNCNIVLGAAHDDPRILFAAILYLIATGTAKDSTQTRPESTRAGRSKNRPEQLSFAAF